MSQDAIAVKFAHKRYSKSQSPILDGLNMTVPRGCIYGLLGASGCGKTTLLSCIVGIRKLDHGEIWVLGGKPGQLSSGIPGPRVGYMPQEISLVKEFSVIGALYYFGRINGLEDSVIDDRFDTFTELMNLPPKDRLVKHLSGGQQRRVSFAAALIHKPELLILDEPTVGLDPILREKIWNFLVKITKEEGTAIVITTHYIEEAKLANKVGLLRCGQLLAETTPNTLLRKFQCSTLEEAFLILSQNQKDHRNSGNLQIGLESGEDLDNVATNSASASQNCLVNNDKQLLTNPYTERRNSRLFSSISGKIFKALLTKNILQFVRDPGGILFALLFPIVQVTFFFCAIGMDPKDVVMAIVNDEAGDCNHGKYLGSVIYKPEEGICDYIDISCRFLHGFNDSIMKKKYYDSMEEAKYKIKKGKAAGAMYFSQNFSRALQYRRDNFNTITEKEIYFGEIHTLIDLGDRPIGMYLQKALLDRFLKIHGDIMTECNISRKVTNMPFKLEKPIFGSLDMTYRDFVAPGFLITLTFFLATSVTSSIIITDRAEGVWDRSLVQGVTTAEILFSHILTQMLVIGIQISIVMFISFVQFKLVCDGSFLAVIGIISLSSICGMCYGFLISVWCPNHTMANFLSTGSFYPFILLGGSIWPTEGMPMGLRYVSFSLPVTIPSISLRNILNRGYSITDHEVYKGFLIVLAWILGFIIFCLIGLRKKTA